MNNYFSQGNQGLNSAPNRLNLNSHNLSTNDYSDLSSLSMSMANACLSPVFPPSNSQRSSSRTGPPFSTNQPFQTIQGFNSGPVSGRGSILSQFSDNFTRIREEDAVKSTLLASRFNSRTMDQTRLQRPPSSVNNSQPFNRPLSRAPRPPGRGGLPVDMSRSYASAGASASGVYLTADDEVDGGNAKPGEPQWLLNPPAPERIAEHLRTGRANELRCKSIRDRIHTASYMDEALRQRLRNKLKASAIISHEDSKFPTTVGAYMAVSPIESGAIPRISEALGVQTQCFKAWSPRLSCSVLLRRVVPAKKETLSAEAFFLARKLCEIASPCFVRLRDVVPVQEFGDNSVIFVYDYVACCSTLQQLHMAELTKPLAEASSLVDMLPEKTAWLYLVQLTQALRFSHLTVNRSIGCLHPSKVLVVDGTRLFVNCFGLRDVVSHSPNVPSSPDDKMRDFVSLGKLILGVVCGTQAAVQNAQQYLQLMSQKYSHELLHLIQDLLTGSVGDIEALTHATAGHAFDYLSSFKDSYDHLERETLRSLENGKHFRMICKLNSVVERNDLGRQDPSTPQWSEIGERYMLKLFRDFVFHQVDQRGAAYLDLAHIVATMNKVEAASPERLCLVSRDGQRVIIVTYADINRWLDASFASLVEEHRRSLLEQQIANQRSSSLGLPSMGVGGDEGIPNSVNGNL